MSYFIDWRDYVRQPRIKSLIESKGMEAARQEYIRESNKAMWDDPLIINESLYSSADPTTAAAGAGGSSPSIVGHVAEVSKFEWASTVTNNVTGSAGDGLHGYYFEVAAYNGSVDYSYNHVNSTKKFRFYFVSSSTTGFTATDTTGVAGIVTASYSKTSETVNVTGSLLSKLYTAILGQGATAVVAGFTNTIAPSTLFAPTMSVGSSSLSLVHVNKGGVPNIISTVPSVSSSVSVTTNGLDRYWGTTTSMPGPTFDGAIVPYTTYARRG
jgi:hypothetical protein